MPSSRLAAAADLVGDCAAADLVGCCAADLVGDCDVLLCLVLSGLLDASLCLLVACAAVVPLGGLFEVMVCFLLSGLFTDHLAQ